MEVIFGDNSASNTCFFVTGLRPKFAPLEGHKGVKAFTALLDGLSEDGSLKLTLEGGESIVLGRDKISQVRLHFSF